MQSQERESSHVFCVRGIDVATYYEFANDSLNCSNSVVFFALHIIVNPYLVSYCQSLNVMLTDCFVIVPVLTLILMTAVNKNKYKYLSTIVKYIPYIMYVCLFSLICQLHHGCFCCIDEHKKRQQQILHQLLTSCNT